MLPSLKNYQVIEELGRGGMATVYKAWQPSLSRLVALKVLPPYFAHDEELLLRFRHEARAVAKLRHPHIVQVYDFHQEEDWFYLAMEFVAGGSLQQKLSTAGRLSPAEAVAFAGQVAEGLHHAHDKGFIHRDIKPSNILLTDEGEAVITDFGIVKALEGTGLTRTVYGGMGTSEYMSPEQAKGAKVGRQSDLYSLGIVLYEALTGGPPFAGESPMAVMHSQIYDEPAPPSEKNPNIGGALEEIIMKLLAKEAAQRFSSGLEVVAALTSVAEGGPGPAPAANPPVDRPTLVRRETRVARVPFIKGAARPREEPEQPEFGQRQGVTAPGEDERPAARRVRVGPALVAALILFAAWTTGNLISYALISPGAGVAAAAKAKAPKRTPVRPKAASERLVKPAPPVVQAEASSTLSTSVTPTPDAAASTTPSPPPDTPALAPALSPAPIKYRPPLPPPAPRPDDEQNVPIVIE